MVEITVYMFTGFLGSGKTTFIQTTLEDKRFNNGVSTLLLLCEDGEEEYDPSRFASQNAIHIEAIESSDDLTEERLAALLKTHRAKRVVVEYNGMWLLEAFLAAMPAGWVIYQEMSFAEAPTYRVFNANMRNLVGDKLKNCDMIIFTHFTSDLDGAKPEFHKIVRSVSRNANIAYDYGDHAEPDDIEDPLPFDINAPVIEIADSDYGLVARNGKLPPNSFIIGRHIMTCCANDVMYGGLACKWTGASTLSHLDWVKLTARISIENSRLYNNDSGPVLNVLKVQKTTRPDPEIVTFN